MNEQLLKAIEELKAAKGLSDSQFARDINLDPANWYRKKNGITKLDMDDLKAMVKAFPELSLVIYQSIGKDDPEPVRQAQGEPVRQ